MQNKITLQDEILQKTKQAADIKYKKRQFRPGIDDVPVSGMSIGSDDIIQLVDTALDGWFTEGKCCRSFANLLKGYIGKHHAVLCNSGSSASLLASTALKEVYGTGKVIVCATSFPTTISPLIQNGFDLLFVDVDPLTLNLDIDTALELLEKEDVIGIAQAHTLGFPFNSLAIKEKADEQGKFFMEDVCDALGAEFKDRPVGIDGNISTFSFFPAHQISTGEGGATLTNYGKLYRAMQSYGSWGRDCWCLPGEDNTCGKRFEWKFPDVPDNYDHKYVFSRIGYNLKMTEMQGSLGLTQIMKLNEFVAARQHNFFYLMDNLEQFGEHLLFVNYPVLAKPSPFGFPITVTSNAFSRNDLVSFLERNKIRTRPVFAGNITRQPMMNNVRYQVYDELLGADYVMERTFWIGCHPNLTDKHLNYVIEKIFEFMDEY